MFNNKNYAIMKKVIKNLKSQNFYSKGEDVVKLCKDENSYTVEYLYSTMSKYKILEYNNIKEAELEFLKITMFILS